MPAPFGDGLFVNEPPAGHGLNITDLFHIINPKPNDPGNDSKVDSKYPNVAIITPDSINNRFGGMWAKEQLDLSLPFSTEIYLHLGHQYGKKDPVADGMTFTLHNDPDGIDAIGGAGEGLGVYRGRKWKGTYWNGYPVTEEHGTFLKNSLVIEFDTYRNTIAEASYVDDPAGPYPAHCALLIPRSRTILESDHQNIYFFSPSQNWIRFEANWTPDKNGGGILNYTFDEHPMSYQINDIVSIFGGTKVYWGFTGASGYYTSVQAAAITRLPEQGIIVEKIVKNADGEDIDKGSALPGDIISYTIRVTARTVTDSIGPIIIKDEISGHVAYAAGLIKVKTKAGDESDIMSSYSGSIMTLDTRQLLAADGDWIEITFNVRVNDDAARSIVYNKAVIEAAGLSDSQDTNTTEVTILAEEDPVKSISDSSKAGRDGSAVKLGDEITYEIAYINYGAAVATITITDVLPYGVSFVPSAGGGDYNETTRTVTWTIADVPAGEEDIVSVVVRVNEDAVVKIENSAEVKVGTNEPRFTGIVENPVTPQNPEKNVSDSSAAGKDGSAVKLGDEITYDITYLNYEETTAKVVITDKLPDGVDFVSAADGDYNEATHTVTWTIPDVPSGEEGVVSVVVRVNETAVVKIGNEATVQVGANRPLTTNIAENPVTPQNPVKKVSDTSAAGQGRSAVKVGDFITYEITYLNHEETAVTIVITDKLPDGVDLVSTTSAGRYDSALHTVIWTLTAIPSGASGIVSAVVLVNARALVNIENSATVKVGANEPLTTNIVENPLTPEAPVKRVSDKSIAGKGGSVVKAGDEITYDILYRNYEATAARVVITDRLPVGVDFVSASDGGTHNDVTHTVTWTISTVPGGDTGMVSVVVRVNEKALVAIGNYAAVQVVANNPRYTNYVENPINGSNCPKLIRGTKCRKTIKGKKIWEDNNNIGKTRPPAVDIILKMDGEVYKSISVSSTGNGSFAFGCLPIWKNSYNKYEYQVDEIIPTGYRKIIEGYNIINTL